MKPAKLDLPTIWRGCDWGPVTMNWKDVNGDPINLSGWQPVAMSQNINLHASIPPPNGVAQGIVVLQLDRTQTLNLRLGSERWDFIWQRIAGQYRFPPFLGGTVLIKDPVSGVPGDTPPGIPTGNGNGGNIEPPTFTNPPSA